MASMISHKATLTEAFLPAKTSTGRVLRAVAMVLIGTALLTLSAKINVPFWPVHMTMQTAVVLMIGAAYGWRLGTATILAYLAEGALGLPVFTGTPEKGIGLAYMMGPTGGFLLGFVAMAFIVGWFADRGFDRRPFALLGVMVFSQIVLFAMGLFWLGTLLGWDKPILEWGLYPFILPGLAKVGLACAAITLGWQLFRKMRG